MAFELNRTVTLAIPPASASEVVLAAIQASGLNVAEVDRWTGTIVGSKAKFGGSVVLLIVKLAGEGAGTNVQMSWSQSNVKGKVEKNDADLQGYRKAFEASMLSISDKIQKGPAW